jgi:hypothetical protein
MGKKSKRKTKTKPPVVVDDVTITSDEALFKDPPAKEDCPICFLPMPVKLFSCMSLSDATISSVPISDYVNANERMSGVETEEYYECCGKGICKGCSISFITSGNYRTCPFCKADKMNKTDEERVAQLVKRVEANDARAICAMACYHRHGHVIGLQQDYERAMELWTRAAALGSSFAHNNLAGVYHEGGDLKKAKFHFEAAAMAGHEVARNKLAFMEAKSGNMERGAKHWIIAASAGDYDAMQFLIISFRNGRVSRVDLDSTLTAYNDSCKEMRSEARDNFINMYIDHTGAR